MNKEPNQSLYNASLILGTLTIISTFMMTVYIPFILGGLAIILAVLSKGRMNVLPRASRIGVITAVIGIVMNIILVGGSVYTVFTNPDMYKQFDEVVQQMYGESFEDMIEDLQNSAYQNVGIEDFGAMKGGNL